VQVKQAALSGEMSVRMEPGIYSQMFGSIHDYTISDVYDFHDKDARINVRFNDAATADVGGQIKYRMPMSQEAILKIHRDAGPTRGPVRPDPPGGRCRAEAGGDPLWH
jgi:hypothetical protein